MKKHLSFLVISLMIQGCFLVSTGSADGVVLAGLKNLDLVRVWRHSRGNDDDHDGRRHRDKRPPLVCSTAMVDTGAAIPTITVYGQFCDEPGVELGQQDGTFEPAQVLASGVNFVTADITGLFTPGATIKTLVRCLPETCEIDVAFPLGPVCGDGVVDFDEECDDGNVESNDGCSSLCEVEFLCGNGVVESEEACDDGNALSSDGCSATCQLEPGATCEVPGSPCTVCGNGQVEGFEACDDGNALSSDGCSATCQLEPGATCEVPGSPCTVCGNGQVEGFEACDDGNMVSNDECSSTCQLEEG